MKNFFIKNYKNITYVGIYFIGLIICGTLAYFINIWYIYEFLIATPFIFIEILSSNYYDKRVINFFLNPKSRLDKKEKFSLCFSWVIKFLIFTLILVFCIIWTLFNLSFINGYGLLVGVIITFIIILISEFFKFKGIKNS